MEKTNIFNNGIPVSVSMNPLLEAERFQPRVQPDKKRILYISLLAVVTAAVVAVIARFLVYLISFFTNISFFGKFTIEESSPAHHHLGPLVIIVPVIGGIIVGLMAYYGSRAIRGHGIPEAMEQILTNKSRIKPSITYLKPLSAAISIGTGGPFGAEGPIIATGGALGSTLGQLLSITHNERKVLLAAGATAGMSAIFNSPIAATFLAIELLLFEFSPRSIIPVILACITGAAGHHLLFGNGPVFEMAAPGEFSGVATLTYLGIGLLLGVLAAGITKLVYFIEDAFEKLPVHWMWWPAIGGIAVGVTGYFYPRTLGVGYSNISDLLSGNLPLAIVFSLCVMKFISWSIALGSGTSGGTLAPLLTIGGAAGVLCGKLLLDIFPGCGITLPLAALTGMAAMFAGASRALLTSIIFAVETTGQPGTFLPLLCSCATSFTVSFFLMENTIMTEKIARRGVKTPHSYEPDLLEVTNVENVMTNEAIAFSTNSAIEDIRQWTKKEGFDGNYIVLTDDAFVFSGIVSTSSLYNEINDGKLPAGSLIKRKTSFVKPKDSLKKAMHLMAEENTDVLPVISDEDEKTLLGILTYRDILSAYRHGFGDHTKSSPNISLRRQRMKLLMRGQQLISSMKGKK